MSNTQKSQVRDWFENRTAIVATMHQKEQAIAPILQPPLGISITVPESFDTDTFGTFTRLCCMNNLGTSCSTPEI
jgi:hypothetical protein